MPDNDALETTLALAREFARTVLAIVRMPDPEQPAVRARATAITLLLTSARLICKCVPPIDPIPTAILTAYEETFQKLSEQLVRDLLPEEAERIDAELLASRDSEPSSSRDRTIASLKALAETAAKDGKIIKPPPAFLSEPEGDDGEGNE